MGASEDKLPHCKLCGSTVPEGKELCWCCEHTPKLHKDVEVKSEDKGK